MRLNAGADGALSACLLHLNGIIGVNDVIDAKSLPLIEMPNRDNFIRAYPPRN